MKTVKTGEEKYFTTKANFKPFNFSDLFYFGLTGCYTEAGNLNDKKKEKSNVVRKLLFL